MNEHGLDASAHVRTLFRTTGVVSGDLLDRRVLGGLVRETIAKAQSSVVENGPGWLGTILIVIVILIVARLLGKLAAGGVRRALSAPALPMSTLLQDFFVKVTANVVLLLGVLVALAQLGIDLAPVLAGLGIAGFIIGFALQDTAVEFRGGPHDSHLPAVRRR